MPAHIRHKDVKIQVLRAGALIGTLRATDITVTQDATKDRSQYAGSPDYFGDLEHQGWSGSVTVEVTGSEVDDLVDAQINERARRDREEEVQIVYTELYADGGQRTYRFSRCFVTMGARSSQGARYTKTLDFQADERVAV